MGRSTSITGRLARRGWPLVGLLLTLTLLGHDLLMAADTHAAAPADRPPLDHLGTGSSTEAESESALPHSPAEPTHATGCEVARPAAPPTDDDGIPAGPGAASGPTTLPALPLAPSGGSGRGKSTWPPSTHRALLQVFLMSADSSPVR